MAYVSFISDRHLLLCIKDLFEVYKKCHSEMTLKKFYKNRVDPIKFLFDSNFNQIEIEDYLLTEVSRQHDKTISNAIGEFHEKLIGGIEGFKKLPVGHGHDVENETNTIFAEIKNKHNTVKGEDLPSIHKKLAKIADKYPNATCYYVRIIDKKSQDQIWNFNSKKEHYQHPKVRIISGDKFYALATGRPNAFRELCDVLPQAIKDFMKQEEIRIKKGTNTSLINEIAESAGEYNIGLLDQIFFDNFSSYNGFKK